EAELAYWELLPPILEKEMADISGGERQRVALTLAILLDRDIFLLDEVTSGLDAPMKRRVIERFTGNDAWTVLTASHDGDWAAASGLRVVELED
ncbi:MAG: ATP-binding cassette domain-containing protein, partial [Candidatus Geothermincolia bacterium]